MLNISLKQHLLYHNCDHPLSCFMHQFIRLSSTIFWWTQFLFNLHQIVISMFVFVISKSQVQIWVMSVYNWSILRKFFWTHLRLTTFTWAFWHLVRMFVLMISSQCWVKNKVTKSNLSKNLVPTLGAAYLISAYWNLFKMFVLMIS